MSTTIKTYSLSDFNRFANSDIVYTLPPDVIHIIEELSKQVGSPEYVRTPNFDELRSNNSSEIKRFGRNPRQNITVDTNFNITRPSKPVDPDNYNDKIRKVLNKITTKTYNELFPLLIEIMDKIVDLTDEYKKTVSSLILTIVSETAFYSDMYASLYSILYEKYAFLHEALDDRIQSFIASIDEITYYNPDTEYDDFCKNNKDNVKRKSVGNFLVNLTKKHIIDIGVVCEIIETIQNKLIDKLDDENKSEIVVEMSEIAGDMIVTGKDILTSCDNYKTISGNVKKLSTMKTKDHKSLSNKTVFKNMDVCDAIF